MHRSSVTQLTARLAAGAAVVSTLVIAASNTAGAANVIVVTTTADIVAVDGLTSLREAVDIANGDGDDSVVQLGNDLTYQLTDCVAKEPIDFGNGFFGAPADDDANLDGDLDHTAADDLTIEGNGSTIENTCLYDRVIDSLHGDARLVLDDLTVTGGVGAPGEGGNVFSLGGATLTSVQILDSREDVGAQGGALVVGESVPTNPGNLLVMTDSTVLGNEQSGVRINTGDAVITNSGFFDNGIHGVTISFGTLDISDSTLVDNGVHGVSGIDGSITATDVTAGGNGGYGLRNTGNSASGQPLEVVDSRVIANLSGGVRCSYCTDLVITGSTIELNDGTGVSMVTNVVGPTMSIVETAIVENGGAPIGTGSVAVEAGGVDLEAQDGVTPTASVVRSTIADNQAAPGASGGGVRLLDAGLTVSNSTITTNSASSGGGVSATGTGLIELSFTTLVDNATNAGAANLDIGGALTIGASVVALPTGGANCSIGGLVTSDGGNQSDDLSCQLTGGGDIAPSSDPMLGALADNGGPTPTRQPLAGSPLRGAVSGPLCDATASDQRGEARPQGPACEVGAVELDETPRAVMVAGRDPLVGQDRALRAAIESHGFAVTSLDDDDLTAPAIAALDEVDVVVVSSSVVPAKVGHRLNDVTAPVLSNEAFHFVDLGIATSSSETAPTKNIIVVDPTSGFDGYVGALKVARPLSAGEPVADATIVAIAPKGDRPVAFSVAPGSTLADGSTAAGPRGAFLLSFRAPRVAQPATTALLGHMLGVLTGG